MIAAVALLLYAAGIALAFGWRTYAHWRRTGDSGLRLDAGPPLSRRWWIKLTFVAALLLGFVGPAAGLAGLAPVHTAFGHPAVTTVGLVLALIGVLATLAAQASMGASWRVGVDPGEHTDLVTSGAFAVARDPIFTAMVITSAGLALMVPNAVSFAALLALIASVQCQVRVVEEPYLVAVHGAAYLHYANRVGRFVPGVGRMRQRAVPPIPAGSVDPWR